MAVSLKHSSVLAILDDPAYPVGSDEWNDEHVFTIAADRFLGRLATPGAVQELTATDLGNLLAGASLLATAYCYTPAGFNAQTGTTYTLAASDNGKIITLNNAAAITLTVPASSSLVGSGSLFSCMLVQLGAGQVGVVA